ncbi:hypothetical protein EYF80_041805 [Liparis tanakae]|uniref:Uncharacterized protein n=1 Tax=Liparis tanakae TaxID=230148 RepID=A0A4Z2G5W4_9TELE|nr:hypothetical protein EYF80_041805 [Liparis tanakae]
MNPATLSLHRGELRDGRSTRVLAGPLPKSNAPLSCPRETWKRLSRPTCLRLAWQIYRRLLAALLPPEFGKTDGAQRGVAPPPFRPSFNSDGLFGDQKVKVQIAVFKEL